MSVQVGVSAGPWLSCPPEAGQGPRAGHLSSTFLFCPFLLLQDRPQCLGGSHSTDTGSETAPAPKGPTVSVLLHEK